MLELASRPRIGPYILTRDLGPSALGDRQLALHESDYSSHVLHRLRPAQSEAEERRWLDACEAAQAFRHPHTLPIERFGLDDGQVWIITPYTGDVDGLVTLGGLLRAKGGYFAPAEARQAIIQLLEVARDAHDLGLAHGHIALDEVLVDRRGSLLIEHYGLLRAAASPGPNPLAQRDEVRSLVRLGYQILTGLVPDAPVIPAGRVVPLLDPLWDDWFETGLIALESGGPGFKSAAHAHSAIASRLLDSASLRRTGGVRTALRRFLVRSR